MFYSARWRLFIGQFNENPFLSNAFKIMLLKIYCTSLATWYGYGNITTTSPDEPLQKKCVMNI